MSIFEWFSINHTLVTIPLGGGYAMSWIEAVGTLFGLACIWCASQEKTINYLFGLINVSLFAIILYGWYAWTRPANAQGDTLQIRWLSKSKLIATAAVSVLAIALLTLYIDPVFAALARTSVALLNLFGANLATPEPSPDAFPFWDASMTVLSVVAQILMTRKYVENWILWVVINIISIGVYAAQGVYAMSLEYLILLFIAANGTRLWMVSAKRPQQEAIA
jgi:nicotinamide mononucleotide transporter